MDRNLYQTAANAYMCSIMGLLHWKRSRFLNARDEGAQIYELTPFYKAAKMVYPLWCQNYPFEGWIGFLESSKLILLRESPLFVTIAGRDFLKYLVGTGKTWPFHGWCLYCLTWHSRGTPPSGPPQLRRYNENWISFLLAYFLPFSA